MRRERLLRQVLPRSRKLAFVFVAAVLTACVPFIPEVGVATIPSIPDQPAVRRLRTVDKPLLVVPVWRIASGYHEEGRPRQVRLVIDQVRIIQSAQVDDIPRLVPQRAYAGLSGVASGVGTRVDFEGIYLLDERGGVVLMLPIGDTWKAVLSAKVDRDWQKEIVASFRTGKYVNVFKADEGGFWQADYSVPCELWMHYWPLPCREPVQGRFPHQPVELDLTQEERDIVVDFVSAIATDGVARDAARWRQE